jgi:hypothetical protein
LRSRRTAARPAGQTCGWSRVEAAQADPLRFHLMIVENVRQGDPAGFQVLDITGDLLVRMLERKREKHYFEVPFPVAVYDALCMEPD